MSKEKKNTVVPKLRFPEFREAGEWSPHKLGELFTERQETGFPELPLLSLTEKDGIIPQEDTNRKNNSSADKSKYLRICPGDVAYNTMRMWEGRSAFVDKEGLVSPAYTVCKPNDDVDGLFFSYYFKTQQLIKQFHRYSQGLVKDTLNLKFAGFSAVEAPSPEKAEQQKIATLLTTLDELISAQGEKIKALQAHKKGLMQQLFPAEGERAPRVRFGEFEGSGEWEEKVLGRLGDVLMCKRIFAEETNDKEGVPFYKIGTLGGKPDAFINRKLFDEYKSKYNYPRKGEILITCSGTVGKCLPYNGEEAYYQDSNIVWIDNPSLEIKNELLFYILSNVSWGKLNSTTITRIYGPDLKNLSIKFPKNPKEQQKIADCLTTLDELIAAQSQKLEALKRQKKGLMQQLFPSPKTMEE